MAGEQRFSRASRIGDLVDSVLEHASAERPFRPEAVAAVGAWPDVVPDKLAAISRAVNLTDGKLMVEVKEPAWKQELLLHKKKIIRQLNRHMGAQLVGDIVFTVRNYKDG